jgi:hypothetical protein
MSLLTSGARDLVALGAALGSNCIPCIEHHPGIEKRRPDRFPDSGSGPPGGQSSARFQPAERSRRRLRCCPNLRRRPRPTCVAADSG